MECKRERASVALSAEQETDTPDVFHVALRGESDVKIAVFVEYLPELIADPNQKKYVVLTLYIYKKCFGLSNKRLP